MRIRMLGVMRNNKCRRIKGTCQQLDPGKHADEAGGLRPGPRSPSPSSMPGSLRGTGDTDYVDPPDPSVWQKKLDTLDRPV